MALIARGRTYAAALRPCTFVRVYPGVWAEVRRVEELGHGRLRLTLRMPDGQERRAEVERTWPAIVAEEVMD
jgi:hypothetical protein